MSKDLNKIFNKVYDTEEAIEIYANSLPRVGLWNSERILINKYKEGKKVFLDLGTGIGRIPFNLENFGFEKIYANDLCEKFIFIAELINKQEKRDDITFLHLDSAKLTTKIQEGSVDFAFYSFNGIMCVPTEEKRIKILREIYKVLSPNGIAIITAANRDSSEKIKKFFIEDQVKWNNNQNNRTLEKFGDTTYKFDNVDGFIRYTSISEMKQFISNTDFKIIEYISRDELVDEDDVVKEFGNNTTFWVLKK
ncbi:class I SAM-dependent methyltransferase [Mycoplasmopsis anatis]|uniref:Class I SAM-dependent methyltransferase n=1 Tax=Mycoplasmopsis anatis TaxID=171279 RepID=A0A9Q3L5I4_9BACT|nr:class I SAM-dependent methyltransferase [Mycoplasmopsis anatis]MBW0595155.1 class I SAM-dependent methyltransferase [Mycoplasmopsis anatis]MBW0596565.1 class I SAM-dependent methyltransferase [Mycoplasmopsis anatis]MBW0599712.1 class I SAM-dependent methyltransferase [Mycoplasmopsis anatis]MBW0601729.1 class I SAM-dependent methyltransferase [Mycoplasmopsis anatis]MBW0602348.1 class I SAM-dependent methyltransferase [Mycoplasmopsis anatis]